MIDPGDGLSPPGAVPCAGCVRCCLGDAVRLLPGDDPDSYLVEPHPLVPGALMLAHREDGACIYLADHGCSIHPRRPQQCREADCRNIASALTYTQARKLARAGVIPIAVWRRGRELLGSG